jgi:hypothetical protein
MRATFDRYQGEMGVVRKRGDKRRGADEGCHAGEMNVEEGG